MIDVWACIGCVKILLHSPFMACMGHVDIVEVSRSDMFLIFFNPKNPEPLPDRIGLDS